MPPRSVSSSALAPLSAEAESFIVGIHALESLSAKYLASSPDGKHDTLRRPVAPGDQATLKPLIAESDRFVATHPAGHAIWRSLLQQLSRQGGPATVRAVAAAIERSKSLVLDYRLERIAAVGKQLSHLIEMFPQRPFSEALTRLTADEQEIFRQAVSQREWSDLFLSPLAQKVIQSSRSAAHSPPHAASVADVRRRKSAAYTARQVRATDAAPAPNRGKRDDKR
jgi:hypothetical protein